jgi:hypothetical protein
MKKSKKSNTSQGKTNVKKLATKPKFKVEQLALIISVFALVGVAVLGISQARGGGGGGTGNGSALTIFVSPECANGTWVNHANSILNSSSIGSIDIYETANSTQIRKIIDMAPLSTANRYYFDSTPLAGVSNLRMYAILHNYENPAPMGALLPAPNEAIYTSNQVSNPCAPPSGKNR